MVYTSAVILFYVTTVTTNVDVAYFLKILQASALKSCSVAFASVFLKADVFKLGWHLVAWSY
jgi:hypothetical protein